MKRMMKMKQIKIHFTLVILMAGMVNVIAQDWPQYLGPNRNSLSDQKAILRSWPQKGPEVLWTAEVGIGFGGPVVKTVRSIYSTGTTKLETN
jgi:hypothetical protein